MAAIRGTVLGRLDKAKLGVVIVLGARGLDRINALSQEISTNGVQVLALQTDVTSYERVKNLVEAASEVKGEKPSLRRGFSSPNLRLSVVSSEGCGNSIQDF